MTRSKRSAASLRSCKATKTVTPRSAQLVQDHKDVLLGVHIQAGERFVHQNEFRFLRQSAGDKHPLLLAAGQLPDLPAGQRKQLDRVERARFTSS